MNPYAYSIRKLGITEEQFADYINEDIDSILKDCTDSGYVSGRAQPGNSKPGTKNKRQYLGRKQSMATNTYAKGFSPDAEGTHDSSGVSVQPNVSLEDRKEEQEHSHTLDCEQQETVGCVSQQGRLTRWDVSSFHLPVDELQDRETAQGVSSSLPVRVTFGPTPQTLPTTRARSAHLTDRVLIDSLTRRSPLERYKSRKRANLFEPGHNKLSSIEENLSESTSEAFNPPLRVSEDAHPPSPSSAFLTGDTTVRVPLDASKRTYKRGDRTKSSKHKCFVEHRVESGTFLEERSGHQSDSLTGKEGSFPLSDRLQPVTQRWNVGSPSFPVKELQDLEASQAYSSPTPDGVSSTPTSSNRHSPLDLF